MPTESEEGNVGRQSLLASLLFPLPLFISPSLGLACVGAVIVDGQA